MTTTTPALLQTPARRGPLRRRGYWISLTDVGDADLAFLLLAVANSALGRRFYDQVCGNRLYAGRRRRMTQYVARRPLPDPHTEPARRLVAAAKELLTSDGAAGAAPAVLDALVERSFGLALTGG